MDARTRTPPISLIIPAYNEEKVIAQAVQEAEASLSEHFDDFELIVVDDGSSDATATVVKGMLQECPQTKLIRHAVNRGYGAALRTGFEAARFDLIAFTDADCQFDLADLVPLARLAELFMLAVGYRADRKDSWKRRLFSRGYNFLARTLVGTRVRDVDCALKVFRRDALAQVLPESKGFFVNTEMMTRARLCDLPVVELPVTHRPRANGESKVSIREVPRIALRLLKFWWTDVINPATDSLSRPVVFQGRLSVPEVGARNRLPAASTTELHPVVPPGPHQEAA